MYIEITSDLTLYLHPYQVQVIKEYFDNERNKNMNN